MNDQAWRKSSRSDGNNNNCVRLRSTCGALDAVGDTKAPDRVLTVEVVALVEWAKRRASGVA